MFDGFPDVLVFLDVLISRFFGFADSTKNLSVWCFVLFSAFHVQHNHSVLFSVFLMLDLVDVGGAALLSCCYSKLLLTWIARMMTA